MATTAQRLAALEAADAANRAAIAALTARVAALEPAPAPTPTPTPTPVPTPAPTPVPTGRPGASNTGVPAGTVLRASASINATTAGAVYEGLDISGGVAIRASGVVLRKCRIRGTADGYNTVRVHSGSVTLEDCEVDATGVENAIAFGSWSAVRCNIHSSFGDGVKFGSATRLEASWIHDLKPGAGAHADGGQVQFGVTDLVIRGNTIDLGNVTDANAALFICPDQGPSTAGPVLIEGNYLNGGNYTLACLDGNNGQYLIGNITIRGNRFGRRFSYGPSNVNVPVTASGNVWDDTGAALSI